MVYTNCVSRKGYQLTDCDEFTTMSVTFVTNTIMREIGKCMRVAAVEDDLERYGRYQIKNAPLWYGRFVFCYGHIGHPLMNPFRSFKWYKAWLGCFKEEKSLPSYIYPARARNVIKISSIFCFSRVVCRTICARVNSNKCTSFSKCFADVKPWMMPSMW